MSETGYAMWNPIFLHRTWDKRRKAAGLPEKFRERQSCATHRRVAEAAMKLTDAELTALLAGFYEADGATLHASRGGEKEGALRSSEGMRTITRSDLAHGPVPVGDTESFAVAKDVGMPTYVYTYKGSTQRYVGVMAQDVAALQPECVSLDATGHMAVDYSRLFGSGIEAGNALARRDSAKAQASLRATLGL